MLIKDWAWASQVCRSCGLRFDVVGERITAILWRHL
jgi:hypothetical protein